MIYNRFWKKALVPSQNVSADAKLLHSFEVKVRYFRSALTPLFVRWHSKLDFIIRKHSDSRLLVQLLCKDASHDKKAHKGTVAESDILSHEAFLRKFPYDNKFHSIFSLARGSTPVLIELHTSAKLELQ